MDLQHDDEKLDAINQWERDNGLADWFTPAAIAARMAANRARWAAQDAEAAQAKLRAAAIRNIRATARKLRKGRKPVAAAQPRASAH